MPVMIDEVVSEVGVPPEAPGAAAPAGSQPSGPIDMNRLDYEFARRRHRARRRWAD